MEKLFGVDVSLYQGKFNFAQAKNEGVKFVIIKASENNFKDPEFEDNYKRAKNAGLYVGAYHYLKSTTTAGVKSEAKLMIDNCLKGKTFDYPIFVDLEDGLIGTLSKAAITELAKAFMNELEKAGYWAGFYTNLDWYRNKLDGAALAARYSFWYAYWGTECTLSDAQIWQFGGSVNYIRKNIVAGVVCDQDYCYVDYPSLIKAKGLNGYPKPTALKTTASKPTSTKPTATTNPTNITSKPKQTTFKVGDTVKLKSDAVVYGSNEKFAPFVYFSTLYVREINGDRVVVSTLREGAITGAVDKKYLVKA